MHLKILCVGPQWRGSNACGLFKALSRIGNTIHVIDEFYHIPLRTKIPVVKTLSWIIRKQFLKEFNEKIIDISSSFNPDVILVYKGAFILPDTLHKLKRKQAYLVNFYPDVSFHTHGKYLSQTLPLYDLIFTTKTFGIHDMKMQLGIQNTYFIPHGFDPDIHRRIDVTNINSNVYLNDISFIGTWTPEKERSMGSIIQELPHLDIKIFGAQWYKSQETVRSKWSGYEVTGDTYALAINSSTINLGLLSEAVQGASSGDKITSRTFHIPASSGFMMHERTDEISNYFIEDKEIVCFGDPGELIDKIKYYLENEKQRDKIRMAGYRRAIHDHSLDKRAFELLKVIEEKLN
jgi:glycosyltransferase involved in cell wall biosynthesis